MQAYHVSIWALNRLVRSLEYGRWKDKPKQVNQKVTSCMLGKVFSVGM